MGPLDALPVVLRASGPAAPRIVRLVEGELGWQVVGPGLGAQVVLLDVTAAQGLVDVPLDGPADPGPPRILVVAPDDDPVRVAEAMRRHGPAAVLPWPPADTTVVQQVVASVLTHARLPDATSTEIHVGGACGGVGTTTISLAVAGLLAWSGAPTIAVSHPPVPHPTGRAVGIDALGAPGVGAALVAVRGVPGLQLLLADGPPPGPVGGLPARVAVLDRGVAADVGVLVTRRDRAALAALEVTAAGAVVVSDDGAIPVAAIRRAAAGRRVVLVPWSARVARAGVCGRVPASLPGSWLRLLRPLAQEVRRGGW